MKRSNRLIVLVGIILAVLVAGGVFILTQGTGGTGSGEPGASEAPTTVAVVVATTDIPLGTVVDAASMVSTKSVPVTSAPVGYFAAPSDVDGLVMRTDVHTGDVLTDADFNSGSGGSSIVQIEKSLKPGFRAMTVEVDQVSGVGTLLQAGDYVDVVLAMENSDNKLPVDVEGAPTKEGNPLTTIRHFDTINGILNSTSVKVLVQNVEVLGTLLPAPTASNDQGAAASPAPGSQTTTLNGQQEIVVLALTPQQVELVRFTQLDGNLSLVLRSTGDQDSPPDTTTGITLRVLVDKYGVLVPQIVLGTVP